MHYFFLLLFFSKDVVFVAWIAFPSSKCLFIDESGDLFLGTNLELKLSTSSLAKTQKRVGVEEKV